MDGSQFDAWTRRWLDAVTSRRRTLSGLALGALGLRLTTEESAAGPGCKNVGKKCKKKKDCCSGICKGKKGKKKCKAHDTGGCVPGPIPSICDGSDVPCTTSAGLAGNCATTTGNAGYCFASFPKRSYSKDADCQANYGPRAACVKCPTLSTGALCAVVDPVDIS